MSNDSSIGDDAEFIMQVGGMIAEAANKIHQPLDPAFVSTLLQIKALLERGGPDADALKEPLARLAGSIAEIKTLVSERAIPETHLPDMDIEAFTKTLAGVEAKLAEIATSATEAAAQNAETVIAEIAKIPAAGFGPLVAALERVDARLAKIEILVADAQTRAPANAADFEASIAAIVGAEMDRRLGQAAVFFSAALARGASMEPPAPALRAAPAHEEQPAVSVEAAPGTPSELPVAASHPETETVEPPAAVPATDAPVIERTVAPAPTLPGAAPEPDVIPAKLRDSEFLATYMSPILDRFEQRKPPIATRADLIRVAGSTLRTFANVVVDRLIDGKIFDRRARNVIVNKSIEEIAVRLSGIPAKQAFAAAIAAEEGRRKPLQPEPSAEAARIPSAKPSRSSSWTTTELKDSEFLAKYMAPVLEKLAQKTPPVLTRAAFSRLILALSIRRHQTDASKFVKEFMDGDIFNAQQPDAVVVKSSIINLVRKTTGLTERVFAAAIAAEEERRKATQSATATLAETASSALIPAAAAERTADVTPTAAQASGVEISINDTAAARLQVGVWTSATIAALVRGKTLELPFEEIVEDVSEIIGHQLVFSTVANKWALVKREITAGNISVTVDTPVEAAPPAPALAEVESAPVSAPAVIAAGEGSTPEDNEATHVPSMEPPAAADIRTFSIEEPTIGTEAPIGNPAEAVGTSAQKSRLRDEHPFAARYLSPLLDAYARQTPPLERPQDVATKLEEAGFGYFAPTVGRLLDGRREIFEPRPGMPFNIAPPAVVMAGIAGLHPQIAYRDMPADTKVRDLRQAFQQDETGLHDMGPIFEQLCEIFPDLKEVGSFDRLAQLVEPLWNNRETFEEGLRDLAETRAALHPVRKGYKPIAGTIRVAMLKESYPDPFAEVEATAAGNQGRQRRGFGGLIARYAGVSTPSSFKTKLRTDFSSNRMPENVHHIARYTQLFQGSNSPVEDGKLSRHAAFLMNWYRIPSLQAVMAVPELSGSLIYSDPVRENRPNLARMLSQYALFTIPALGAYNRGNNIAPETERALLMEMNDPDPAALEKGHSIGLLERILDTSRDVLLAQEDKPMPGMRDMRQQGFRKSGDRVPARLG